jgi:MFS family permease
MQNVLGYSALQAGVAYVPATLGIVLGAAAATKAIPRIGTRPLIVSGSVIAATGVLWLSGLPVHGDYVADLLPGLIVMSLGLGVVLATVTTAATAGVPADTAGLAAALVNTATQLGGALGIAVLTTVATSHTSDLLAAGTPTPDALAAGFDRALLAAGVAILVAALIGLRTYNTRTEASV